MSLLLTQKTDDGVRISETIKKEQPDCVGLFLFGDPPEIRTPDTLIKSLRVVFVRGVQGRIVESVAEIAPLYLAVKKAQGEARATIYKAR